MYICLLEHRLCGQKSFERRLDLGGSQIMEGLDVTCLGFILWEVTESLEVPMGMVSRGVLTG